MVKNQNDRAREPSVPELQKFAAAGNATAMMALARCYSFGEKGVARDPKIAKQWLERAVAKGDPDAMRALALNYLLGEAGEQNFPKAVEYLKAAAQKQQVGAMVELAMLYTMGQGVEHDYTEARRLYEYALPRAQGHMKGMILAHLGGMYAGELGGEGNIEKALRYYRLAGRLGEQHAITNTGLLYEKGVTHKGKPALAQNYTKAMQYYRDAEKAGETVASIRIASLLLRGLGVEKDEAQAQHYIDKVEQSSDMDGWTLLGEALAKGSDGLPRDPIKAEMLWKKSVEGGDFRAAEHLVELYEKGERPATPAEIEKFRADALWLKYHGMGFEVQNTR